MWYVFRDTRTQNGSHILRQIVVIDTNGGDNWFKRRRGTSVTFLMQFRKSIKPCRLRTRRINFHLVSFNWPSDLSFLKKRWSFPSRICVGSLCKHLNFSLSLIMVRQQSMYSLQSMITTPFPLSDSVIVSQNSQNAVFPYILYCGMMCWDVTVGKIGNFTFQNFSKFHRAELCDTSRILTGAIALNLKDRDDEGHDTIKKNGRIGRDPPAFHSFTA